MEASIVSKEKGGNIKYVGTKRRRLIGNVLEVRFPGLMLGI